MHKLKHNQNPFSQLSEGNTVPLPPAVRAMLKEMPALTWTTGSSLLGRLSRRVNSLTSMVEDVGWPHWVFTRSLAMLSL